jgi:hypothetical protein
MPMYCLFRYHSWAEDYVDLINIFSSYELAEHYLDIIVSMNFDSKDNFKIVEKQLIESSDDPVFKFTIKKFLKYDGVKFELFTLNNFSPYASDLEKLFNGHLSACDSYQEKHSYDETDWNSYLDRFYLLDYAEREKIGVKSRKDFEKTEQFLTITRPFEWGEERIKEEWSTLLNEINEIIKEKGGFNHLFFYDFLKNRKSR